MTSRRPHAQYPSYGTAFRREDGDGGLATSRPPVEDENDALTEGLKDKIRALKSVSVEIGDEVRYHNKLLHEMDDDLEKNKGFLQSTMARVIKLGKAGHNYYILYLMLFACVVFFIVYVIKKLG